MSKKNLKRTWPKIIAIVGVVVAILAWLIPNPIERLGKKTDKGLTTVQQKRDASSAAISKKGTVSYQKN